MNDDHRELANWLFAMAKTMPEDATWLRQLSGFA